MVGPVGSVSDMKLSLLKISVAFLFAILDFGTMTLAFAPARRYAIGSGVARLVVTSAFSRGMDLPRSSPFRSQSALFATESSKVRSALDEVGTKGEFKRRDAAWRNWISRGAAMVDSFITCLVLTNHVSCR